MIDKFRGPEDEDHDPFAETRTDRSIASRQNEYQQKRLHRQISPERNDPFADGKLNYPLFLFFPDVKNGKPRPCEFVKFRRPRM